MSEVRRVRPDEWKALRDVRLRALADTPLVFWRSLAEEEPLPDAHWQRWAGAGARGETEVVLVAERDGRFVGLTAVHPEDTGTLDLIAMWVAPEARGAGIGHDLVAEAIRWARGKAPNLHLWVTEDNSARRIYEAHGFRPTEASEPQRWRPHLRAVQLACDLSTP